MVEGIVSAPVCVCVSQSLHPDMHTNVHCRLVSVQRAVIRNLIDCVCVCLRPCKLMSKSLSVWHTVHFTFRYMMSIGCGDLCKCNCMYLYMCICLHYMRPFAICLKHPNSNSASDQLRSKCQKVLGCFNGYFGS